MKHRLSYKIRMILVALIFAGTAGISMQAAARNPNEQPAYSSAANMNSTHPQPERTASFSLVPTDILSWEESGEGKYLYFTLTPAKNEELAELTEEYRGYPMNLYLDNVTIFIPEVTSVIDQKNGFVLQIADERRKELMHIIGWDKHRKNQTDIEIPGTAEDKPSENPATQDEQ